MSAISVSAAARDKEPEYIVDERVWRSRDESISINFPLEFDHDRRLSVRLLRKGVERCRKEVDAKRGRRTAELCLSKDEEKLFQTGASHEPFELQVLSSDGSRLFSGSFFRFKSTKSKENREESAKPALVASSTPASSTRSSFSSASASARPVHVASSTPASSTTRSTFSSASVASNSLSYISSHRTPHYNLRNRIDDSMITPSTRSVTTRTRSHYRELDSSSTPAPADTSMRSSISSIRSSNPPLRLIPAGYEDYQEGGPLSSTAYEEDEDEEYDYDQNTRNETSDDDDYGSQSQYRREESLGIRIDEKANSLIFSDLITPPKSTSTSSTNHRRIQITHRRRLDQYLVSEDEDDVYEDRNLDRDQRPPSTNFLTPSSTLKSRFSELESITQSIESPPTTPTPKVPSTHSRRLTDISIHSFGLLLTDRDVPSHYRLLKPNIYVEKCEKTMISNHAVRVLVERFGVEFVAQFKVDVQVLTATRSGAVIANRNPLDTFFDDLQSLLRDGIEVETESRERVKFVFIGHSNSGLRERTFWAIDKQSYTRRIRGFDEYLRELGDFTPLIESGSMERLSKRYALNFTSSRATVLLDSTQFVCLPDECTADRTFEFTDGIGIMRIDLAKEISRLLGLEHDSYVFQVRCGGFKGVLAAMSDSVFDRYVANQRRASSIRVVFRNSQRKFNCSSEKLALNVVSWVDYILPSSTLNSEFLMVLDGLSSQHSSSSKLKQTIMARYEKEMSELDECLVKPEKAYKKLFGPMSPSSDLACEFVAKYGTMVMGCERDLRCELDPEHYKVVRNQIIEQTLYKPIMAQKYNLPVEQSRYMMGVLDETGTLPEDTVYVAYRDFKGNVHYLDGVDVIITRTPCYSLSEMRRVRARKVDELSHLVNVVAFPKRGRRPLTNLLSGGDLDGDLYFVSWDGELTASVALNSRVNIDYPSREESSPTRSSGLRGGEAILNELSQYFIRSCLSSNLIGLWHYKLTAIYDSDRSLMTSNQYLEAVKIVNAIIDNAPFKQSNQYFAHKPLWYLTSSQRSNIESYNNTKTKEEKIRSLYRLLIDQHYGDLNSKVADTSSSLLSRLAFATMRKLIELCTDYEQQPLPNGRFFTPDHIRRLEALELIDKDIFDVQLRPENIDKIKRRYDDYCRSHMALEAKKEKKTKPFMGIVETQEFNRRGSEIDTAMIDLTRNFKSALIRLPFDIEDIEGSIEWKSKHIGNNIYTRTRLIRLYEEFVGVYKYSQISWLFYEFLGSMKAELRHEQSRRKNSSLLPIIVRSDFL